MINPQDLADEMYKMDTPYYDSLSQKEKHDIAYKNALAKAAEKEQASQMDSLSSILKNTQPLPQQFAGMQNVEQDPMKRQQILNQQEQAMIAKQNLRPQTINAGGRSATMSNPNVKEQDYTFTDADLEPYKRAGIQSQNVGQINPQAQQYIQAMGEGITPQVANDVIGYQNPTPPKLRTTIKDIPNAEGGKRTALIDEDTGQIIKDYGAYKEKTDNEKNFHEYVKSYNKEIANLQSKGMLNDETIKDVVNRYSPFIKFKEEKSTDNTIQKNKTIDRATALEYKRKAGGDLSKARELARKDGYIF
jgi:hypothetical protein